MTPLCLADALLDALEREGLVPGTFGWERRARRVIAEELEVLLKGESDGRRKDLAVPVLAPRKAD